jgi:hypothetical protein
VEGRAYGGSVVKVKIEKLSSFFESILQRND